MLHSFQSLCMNRFLTQSLLTRVSKLKCCVYWRVGSWLLAKAMFDYSPEAGLHERAAFTDQGIDTHQSNTAKSEAGGHRSQA